MLRVSPVLGRMLGRPVSEAGSEAEAVLKSGARVRPDADATSAGEGGFGPGAGPAAGASGGAFEIRPARPDELAEVGAITLAAYETLGVFTPNDPYRSHLADAARRAAVAEVLVAADPVEGVLGTVTVCRPGTPMSEVAGPDELEFRMLAVAPAARRRGVAAALLAAVLATARELGCRRVVLSSLVEMRAAHALYTRHGFRRAPERDWGHVADELKVFTLELDG
jgi:ribosomal protein S18 acetylase RimI-like enzyme